MMEKKDMTNVEEYSGYGWIKVKKYTVDESLSWEEKYKALEAHHIAETSFLIKEVRKLAEVVDWHQEHT